MIIMHNFCGSASKLTKKNLNKFEDKVVRREAKKLKLPKTILHA